jgi:hypothetical protein
MASMSKNPVKLRTPAVTSAGQPVRLGFVREVLPVAILLLALRSSAQTATMGVAGREGAIEIIPPLAPAASSVRPSAAARPGALLRVAGSSRVPQLACGANPAPGHAALCVGKDLAGNPLLAWDGLGPFCVYGSLNPNFTPTSQVTQLEASTPGFGGRNPHGGANQRLRAPESPATLRGV